LHLVGSQRQAFPEIKATVVQPVPNEFWNLGDVQQGRQLFHRTGCVACHQPDDTYETVATKPTPLGDILAQLDPEELGDAGLLAAARAVESIPLGNLATKYTRKSLTFFLIDPHHVRPASRMPNLQLGPSGFIVDRGRGLHSRNSWRF
jgi:cytochrome c2